jgi:hypothetical protein
MVWYCRHTEVTSFVSLLLFSMLTVQSIKLVNCAACWAKVMVIR